MLMESSAKLWLVLTAVLVHASLVHAQDCTTLGCTLHKHDGWVCQCNFHCGAHGDCCADFDLACPNATDPMAGANHSAHEYPEEEISKKEPRVMDHEREAPKKDPREHTHASASSTSNEHERDATKKEPHEHLHATNATNGRSSASSAKPSAKPAHPSSGSRPRPAEKASGNGPAPAHKEPGGGHHEADKATGKAEHDKAEHDKAERDKADKAKSERDSHPHRGRNPFPWPMVVFGCVVALTVPVTIALMLVLRARGLCGPVPSFQPVQNKDDTSHGLALEPVREESPGHLIS